MVLLIMVLYVWDRVNFNGLFLLCKEILLWVIYYIMDILFYNSIYIVISDLGDLGDWYLVG